MNKHKLHDHKHRYDNICSIVNTDFELFNV